jgi:hypothetical protein
MRRIDGLRPVPDAPFEPSGTLRRHHLSPPATQICTRERARKREDLLAVTERDLPRIAAQVRRRHAPLRGKAENGGWSQRCRDCATLG